MTFSHVAGTLPSKMVKRATTTSTRSQPSTLLLVSNGSHPLVEVAQLRACRGMLSVPQNVWSHAHSSAIPLDRRESWSSACVAGCCATAAVAAAGACWTWHRLQGPGCAALRGGSRRHSRQPPCPQQQYTSTCSHVHAAHASYSPVNKHAWQKEHGTWRCMRHATAD